MDFEIQFLSFFVITVEGRDDQSDKRFKHFKTLDKNEFENSEMKDFLDGELKKIVKRKADHHPKSEQVPTKIGHFVTEPGHSLDSNPNYALLHRTRFAETKEDFNKASEQLVRIYLNTSAVRGGVFLVATAVPRKFYDDSLVFIMKCDFEPKVASISDESSLIQKVEHAITTKNMKSIQYPYMPEEGMIEHTEVKIHQASHARYFEDFLSYVEYGEPMPVIMKNQVMSMVQEHVYETYDENSEERQTFDHELEIWEGSEKREIQERLDTHQVMEAAAQIVEHTPEAELKMKVGETSIKGLLADFGETLHLGKINGRYVLLVEADSIQFEKGVSPIEFHKPDDLHQIIERLNGKRVES
ncbi:DUF3900 domain-containing protein [Alkalicoccobacillus porphyridii]|uniref:DUF3900 domain-containing protein n=1 Tax=Alkalicoccobacillus porphyridii TaxID=2597270 RepID=A0A553ZXE7_9BACI|nr:DUF3900 domain-containing protein [Alkalicoccobacillus porphyridii]TSB46127.1 DUF3900 domain-containing protein [Alkalicoccobacillus porphyridii]